jgi:Ca2+-binding RTX toxin-like protein
MVCVPFNLCMRSGHNDCATTHFRNECNQTERPEGRNKTSVTFGTEVADGALRFIETTPTSQTAFETLTLTNSHDIRCVTIVLRFVIQLKEAAVSIRPWLEGLAIRLSRRNRRSQSGKIGRQSQAFRRSRSDAHLAAVQLESLEDRTLLTAQVLLLGTELLIFTDADESVEIREDPARPFFGQVLIDGNVSTSVPALDATLITSISIETGDGDNIVNLAPLDATVFTALPSISVVTGNGDDTITGSPDLAVTIDAGDGNDTITTFALADMIQAGDGNDTVNAGMGNDIIDAGDGDDIVNGEDGDDIIFGDDGDDLVNGGAGLDTITGGDGADVLNGDGDVDSLIGDLGNDIINGGAGDDVAFGGGGNDSLNGDDGTDSLFGNSGRDVIFGNAGNDYIVGAGGNDFGVGGSGNDVLIGDAGMDSLEGRDGDDTLFGGIDDDSLFGDASLPGQALGNDSIFGEQGNDTILGGGGSDTIDGGTGRDLIESGDVAATPDNLISISDFTLNPEGNVPPIFFGANIVPSGTPDADDVVTGDIDGDSDQDIIVLSNGSTSISILENDGSGNFTQGLIIGLASSAVRLALGDFNADGSLDISYTENSFATDNVHLLFNDGTGAFPTTAVMAATNGPTGIIAVDLDGDNDIDIATANTGFTGSVSVFRNNGDGTFGTRSDFLTGTTRPRDLAAADLDGDGDLDVAVENSFLGRSVQIMINNGTGNLTSLGTALTTTTNGGGGLDLVDIDNDSDIDIVVGEDQGGFEGATLFTNNGGASFSTGMFINGGNQADTADLVADDFNGDGNADLAFVGRGDFTLVLGNGDSTFQMPQSLNNTLFFSNRIASADFNADGAPDIVNGASFSTTNVAIFLNTGVSGLGSGMATLTISTSQVSTSDISVDFTTVNGLAVAGEDYLPVSSTAVIPAGSLTTSVVIPINGDSLVETNENFFVNLSNPANGVIADGQGQVLIIDDDGGAAGDGFSITDVTLAEGNSGTTDYVFDVTLSAPQSQQVTVEFSTSGGTAIGGFDYTTVSGTLTFAPGVTLQQVTVQVVGDSIGEGDESFFVNLSNPLGLVLNGSQGVGTITNDDGAVFAPVPDDTIDGGDGADTILGSIGNDLLVGGQKDDIVDGGGGDDIIYGGSGNDTLLGSEGQDTLAGQGGQDSLNGGLGEDLLIWNGTGQGRDTLSGGEGGDRVQVNASSAGNALTISQSATGRLQITELTATVTVETDVKQVLVNGNGGADVITVGDISNVALVSLILDGGSGDDTINASGSPTGSIILQGLGGDGNDNLIGGLSAESLTGGQGDDVISGGGGNDTLNGNDGVDMLTAGDGDDVVDGGAGNDNIFGNDGDDSLSGGLDNDFIDGGQGNDTIRGGFGDDVLIGSFGDDSVSGDVGKDFLAGGSGADTLDGGRNDDTLAGHSGADKLRGNHGNDSIDGAAGDDEIVGGDGDDTISGGSGNDGISAGDGDDFVIGDSGNDIIVGGDGDDNLLGVRGADTILGEQGDDSINGGSGGGMDSGFDGEGNDVPLFQIEVVLDSSFELTQELMDQLDGI